MIREQDVPGYHLHRVDVPKKERWGRLLRLLSCLIANSLEQR